MVAFTRTCPSLDADAETAPHGEQIEQHEKYVGVASAWVPVAAWDFTEQR